MSSEQQRLQAAIGALEAQRHVLGDAVVEALLAPARAKLVALTAVPDPEPTQALKQVSILFLDVVGSTSLSQHLDPEEIHAVMDGGMERGSRIVAAHKGRVLQFAGDNLLAAFGADGSLEDDAERAVRCGLALLELGRALGVEAQAAHGHAGLNVRVGIHTGGVLLGGGVDAEGTIRGIAVNIAARMEQTAPAGALRISRDTYAQVRGIFEVEEQAPLAVKGVDTPVQSYLVGRAKPRSFRIATRGIEGVATRTIGRDAELEALQVAFKRLFTERRLAAVTVVAEAGIGKSRLLYDFDSWSETRPESFSLFRGRATPQTQGQAFGLLRDILARRFQITADDSVEASRTKLEQGIIPLFLHDDGADLAEGHVHLLGHLIGIEWRGSRHIKGILDDPKQVRNRALHAAAQLFRRVSAGDGAPVVLQLEDLHWADNESLDFLNYLAEVNRDVAMLVLGFSRPELFERRTDWKSTQGIHRRIDIHPLDAAAGRQLVDELLKKLGDVPSALRELIAGRAEGNPFYMEELVKMLIDQGAIRTGSERWTLNPEKLLTTHVPPTLTGVLQARLDGLPAAERLTLQQASIIGQVFWEPALIALDARAKDNLPALVQRELILPRADPRLDDLRQYAFKHQILHQVTYNTVLKPHKRIAHGAVARWLAARPDVGQNELIAEHFERGGEPAQAVGHWQRAAEEAAARYANAAALAHAQRALSLMPADDAERRYALTLLSAKVLRTLAERERLAQCLDELIALAEQLNDDARRSEAAERRARFLNDGGDATQALELARQALAWAPADAPECAARAQLLVASALSVLGRPDDALRHAEAGIARARESANTSVQAMLLNHLGMDANNRGDPGAAIRLFEQALVHHRQANNRSNEAATLTNLAYAAFVLGIYNTAQAQFQTAAELCRQIGQRQVEGIVRINLALVRQCQGDAAGALEFSQSALPLLVQAGDRVGQAAALRVIGHAALALNEMPRAAASFRASREMFDALGLGHLAIETIAGQALHALARQDVTAARDCVEVILDRQAHGASLAGTDEPLRIGLVCHQALAAAGDSRAAEVLAAVHAELVARAGKISDPTLRRGFLDNVPWHRELNRLWRQHAQHAPP